VHLSQQFVVGGKVVNERAAEAQALHQGTHLSFEGAASIHLRTKWLRNSKVFSQDNHVHLEKDMRSDSAISPSVYFYLSSFGNPMTALMPLELETKTENDCF